MQLSTTRRCLRYSTLGTLPSKKEPLLSSISTIFAARLCILLLLKDIASRSLMLFKNEWLANIWHFSIFQSIPDSWAIDQLFPVIPLSHHEKKPSQKATIVDITCDSDGCLEKFIDRKNVRTILDLHAPDEKPYFLGFFLVGAYQESLANEHNLFGATDEVEVIMDENGDWKISKITEGDKVAELLTTRNYVISELTSSYEEQLQAKLSSGNISEKHKDDIEKFLKDQLNDSPYLHQKA